MTEDADFKRLVRERMARTGENYTTARAALRPDEPTPPGTAAGEPLRAAEPPRPAGTGGDAETDRHAESDRHVETGGLAGPIEMGRADEPVETAFVAEASGAAGESVRLVESPGQAGPGGNAETHGHAETGGRAEPIETGRADEPLEAAVGAEPSGAAGVGESGSPTGVRRRGRPRWVSRRGGPRGLGRPRRSTRTSGPSPAHRSLPTHGTDPAIGPGRAFRT